MDIYERIKALEDSYDEPAFLTLSEKRDSDLKTLRPLFFIGVLGSLICLVLIAIHIAITNLVPDIHYRISIASCLVLIGSLLALSIRSSVINDRFEKDKRAFLLRYLAEKGINEKDAFDAIDFVRNMNLLRTLSQ